MRASVFAVALVFLLGSASGRAASSEQEWEDTITSWICNFVEAYDNREMDRVLAGYTSNYHLLKRGLPVISGIEEITQIYRKMTAWGAIDYIRLEDVRFHCADGAVAEHSFSFDGRHGKGVLLFAMEEGVARVMTDIFNFNDNY